MRVDAQWFKEDYQPSIGATLKMAAQLGLIKTSIFRWIKRYYINEHTWYEGCSGRFGWYNSIYHVRGKLIVSIYCHQGGIYEKTSEVWANDDAREKTLQEIDYLLHKIRRKLAIETTK